MVEWLIRLTVLVVLALALGTLGQALYLCVRLGRHVRAKHRDLGLWLWLPAFAGARDARAWLATWRAILGSGDPAIALVRAEARLLAGRYAHLACTSNAWAMAVWAVLPRLG
jgi:hypothetical protein